MQPTIGTHVDSTVEVDDCLGNSVVCSVLCVDGSPNGGASAQTPNPTSLMLIQQPTARKTNGTTISEYF